MYKSGSSITIKFLTDNFGSGRGFKNTYRMLPCDPRPTTESPFTTPPGVTCDRTFSELENFITSVNYPLPYLRNLDCIYRIEKNLPVSHFCYPNYILLIIISYIALYAYRVSLNWKLHSSLSIFKAVQLVWATSSKPTLKDIAGCKPAKWFVYHSRMLLSKCTSILTWALKILDSKSESDNWTTREPPTVTEAIVKKNWQNIISFV